MKSNSRRNSNDANNRETEKKWEGKGKMAEMWWAAWASVEVVARVNEYKFGRVKLPPNYKLTDSTIGINFGSAEEKLRGSGASTSNDTHSLWLNY